MNRSRVTGFRDVPGVMLGFPRSVALHDGATAVPVYERLSFDAQVPFFSSDGCAWITFCHCGPAAPYPKWGHL